MRYFFGIAIIITMILASSGCTSTPTVSDMHADAVVVRDKEQQLFRQIADASCRLARDINIKGTEPHSEQSEASVAITEAISEQVGSPDAAIDAPTEAVALLPEWREIAERERVANETLEQELLNQSDALASIKDENSQLREKCANLGNQLSVLQPVVKVLYWGVACLIVLATIGLVVYHGLVRRVITPTSGTIWAIIYGVGGLTLGVVWYVHGRALIAWGFVGIAIVAIIVGVNYYRKAEMIDVLVERINKFRATATDDVQQAFDTYMSNKQPSWLRDRIKRIKGSLGL